MPIDQAGRRCSSVDAHGVFYQQHIATYNYLLWKGLRNAGLYMEGDSRALNSSIYQTTRSNGLVPIREPEGSEGLDP